MSSPDAAPAHVRRGGASFLNAELQLTLLLFLFSFFISGVPRVYTQTAAHTLFIDTYGAAALPWAYLAEALCVPGVCVLAPSSLEECCAALRSGSASWTRAKAFVPEGPAYAEAPDFSSVLGLSGVKRALEICAAGMHNFLLVGSPGTGKTLSARCLPGSRGRQCLGAPESARRACGQAPGAWRIAHARCTACRRESTL